ncbi:MAG: hypothetical protein QXU98_01930 [Candidatus Parvarchaeota archaeon]
MIFIEQLWNEMARYTRHLLLCQEKVGKTTFEIRGGSTGRRLSEVLGI